MKKSHSNNKQKNLKKLQLKILLIGIEISVILMLLSSCKKTEYIYTTLPKEPIICIDNIKTPLDMANCLQEYKLKY